MKIAFASCMNLKPDQPQQIWSQIAAAQPDYLFLLGDQIYMDFFLTLGDPAGWGDAKFRQVMLDKYRAQWAEPHFRALFSGMRQRQDVDGGVYGTWDDHDFAWNNACGAQVPAAKKAISRQLFSQFMQIDPPAAGLCYAVPLKHMGQTVGKAIFLDTRWYRDSAGDNQDLLGEAQFAFLQQELQHAEGLIVVCAGTPMRAPGNSWEPYRRDHRRFLELIGSRKAIFLSGDIHENIFRPPSHGTRLFEIISSGASVTKYQFFGKRRNYGILDYSPASTTVTLVDKRGQQSYRIDNDSFAYEKLG